MTLEIEITRQDFVDFNTYYYIKKKLGSSILIGSIGLGILLFMTFKDETSVNFLNLTLMALLYIIIFFVITYLQLRNTGKLPAENGAMLGKKLINFTEEGIYCSDQGSTANFNWSAIKKMDKGKKAYYLFMDTSMAIVIPKRVFKDEADHNAFINLVNQKIKVA